MRLEYRPTWKQTYSKTSPWTTFQTKQETIISEGAQNDTISSRLENDAQKNVAVCRVKAIKEDCLMAK